MKTWKEIVKENTGGEGFNYETDVVLIPVTEKDLNYFEQVIKKAAFGNNAEYDQFPDEGGIEIASILLAEVRRLRRITETLEP